MVIFSDDNSKNLTNQLIWDSIYGGFGHRFVGVSANYSGGQSDRIRLVQKIISSFI